MEIKKLIKGSQCMLGDGISIKFHHNSFSHDMIDKILICGHDETI